jgi:hypothetical protein
MFEKYGVLSITKTIFQKKTTVSEVSKKIKEEGGGGGYNCYR